MAMLTVHSRYCPWSHPRSHPVYIMLCHQSKPPVAWDKGRASIYILRTAFGVDWSDRIRIIYAGDDVTDEDAMTALKGLAFSFRVVNSNLTQTSASMR